MSSTEILDVIDEVIARLEKVGWKERDAVRKELAETARQADDPVVVVKHLERIKGDLDLELRWEVDEVIEALTPDEPEPEPEPEIDEPDEGGPQRLSRKDLDLVYDDPRGLMLHKTKKGDRWFATQRDPRTGQPQTFELQDREVQQLKAQLSGSPYWVIGGGASAS